MKLTDEFDKPAKGISSLQVCALAVTVVALILAIVLYLNRDQLQRDIGQGSGNELEEQNTENSESQEKLSASEVWQEIEQDPYKAEQEPTDGEGNANGEGNTSGEDNADPSGEDATHTVIEYADGSTERVTISPYLDKNTYLSDCFARNGDYIEYLNGEGDVISYQGMIVSEQQGIIDYNKAKKAGIDFCMVTLGQRGYQTGTITEDSYFFTHMKQATDAGLDAGVIFYSQAVTQEEAIEEAEFVLERLEGYTVTYPVVFCMRPVQNDTTRTDSLLRMGRTTVAAAFLDKIADAGYLPMLYANKEWLILRYQLNELQDYDIWLQQYKEIPEYPYEYAMWSYDNAGTVNGVSGKIEFVMSLEDFSIK